MPFQEDLPVIRWKILLQSPASKVFDYLFLDRLREQWWVESSSQVADIITFTFPNSMKSTETLLKYRRDQYLEMTYLGSRIRFEISHNAAGTIVEVIDYETSKEYQVQVIAGWGSVLMTLKAAVDFGIDLRNHHKDYCWDLGFFDN